MISIQTPTIVARSAWFVWALLVTLALMFISSLIGVVLIAGLDRWLPRTPMLASGLIGSVVGASVGGFHGLWAQREKAGAPLARWVGASALLGMVSMAAFAGIIASVFDFDKRVALRSALGFGLLYGALCSTLIVLCEWLVLRRHVDHLRAWLSVGWMAWFLLWIETAHLLSDISGMD